MWSQFESLQAPDLKMLALDKVLSLRASSTSRKYLYAVSRWPNQSRRTEFPVRDYQFALYLQHLAATTGSISAVEEAFNVIAYWLHRVTCQPHTIVGANHFGWS